MAAIDRRTTAEIITEVEQQLARSDNSVLARVKEWVSFAHRYCGARWHHFELDKTNTALTATAGTATVDISTLSAHVVVNVDLKTVTGDNFIKSLGYRPLKSIRPLISGTIRDVPSHYSRWGDKLVFEVLPDQAYQLDIDYYARTANLDDATGNLEIAEEWDEPVLTLAVARGHQALWSPELAAVNYERFVEMVSILPNPLLVNAGLPGEPVKDVGPVGHTGGAQG